MQDIECSMATADAFEARGHVKGALLDLRPITDKSGLPGDVIVRVTPRLVQRPPSSNEPATRRNSMAFILPTYIDYRCVLGLVLNLREGDFSFILNLVRKKNIRVQKG